MRKLSLLFMFIFIAGLTIPLTAFAGGAGTGMAEETVNKGTEEKSGQVHYLDEIVTTASRIPHLLKYTPSSVTVITRDRIEAANPQDVGDVLEEVAGLKVERYGSMGSNTTVHIRGLYSAHVLVMVDGRPVNAPSTGSADLSWLSVDNIEKIEIVRGPGSAMYGANAVAGVVNIITRKPPEELTTRITTSFGTWDTLITRFENGLTLKNGLGYLVTANYKNSDGHRANSAHESWEFSTRVSYEFNKETDLTFSTGYYKGRTENPGARPSEDPAKRTESQNVLGNDEVSSLFDYGRNERVNVSGTFNAGYLSVDAYLNRWDDDDHRQWESLGDRHVVDDNFRTFMYGGELQYSIAFPDWNTITAGVNMKEEDFELEGRDHNRTTDTAALMEVDADRTTYAAFLEDEISAGPVTLTLGGRWDDPEDFKSQTSLRASLLWSLADNTNVRASYGDSFRAPTLNDLYWPSDPFAQGNPGLQPERGSSYEIGIEQLFGKKILVRTSFFRQKIKDMIAWAPTGPVGPFGNKWQPGNLNKTLIKGVEVESKISFTKGLDFVLSYTYLDGEQKNQELVNAMTNELSESTRTLSYMPRHKLDLSMDYRDVFTVKGLKFNADAQYVSETYQYYQNWTMWPVVTMDTKEQADYWITNAKLTKEFKNAEVFFAVQNITNEEYAIQFGPSINDGDYPMPGRSFTAGASIEF